MPKVTVKKRVPRKVQPKRKYRLKNSFWDKLTPEEQAERVAKLLAAQAKAALEGRPGGRPKGLPDGIGKKKYDAQVLAEAPNIKLIVERIVADNQLDKTEDAFAIEALTTAVTIMRLEAANRDKLAAAKLVLEYTKAKPSTKAEVTLNTAESFLNQVLAAEEAQQQK